jgi:uncharacterized glyoxalase superfamily protein PhnB
MEDSIGNLVPYLFCEDVGAALEWYERVFGFVERMRWPGPGGRIENAEMIVGDTELWLDGGPQRFFDVEGAPARPWIGVWVDDVDAMHRRVTAAGVEVQPPEDKPYGVRMMTVTDPEGNEWGFMRRI